MFEKYINEQTDRVKNCPQAKMLCDDVYTSFEKKLRIIVETVTKSTVTKYISEEAAADNPFAAVPGLITDEQREKAVSALKNRLAGGEFSFPEQLTDILSLRLGNVTDAFLEMLSRMDENREAVCAALTNGRAYTRIEDVTLSAGDTHNCGRSVAILHTDAGKLVYKPHDMRGDEQIRLLADRFFPDIVGIPKCISFGDSFGVSEFIEKRRAEGEQEARKFWYDLGGMTAFVKILGSTDMHIENITCCGAKPYILDLETVFSPVMKNEAFEYVSPELNMLRLSSPCFSGILPCCVSDREISVLMNTDESGCAPQVNGKNVNVTQYLDELKNGYDAVYKRALSERENIAAAVRAFPQRLSVRTVLRATRDYSEYMKKLYHHTALSSNESKAQTNDLLVKILCHKSRADINAADIEAEQLERGDIPYFYTFADSRSLFSDGKEIAADVFKKSAAEHLLDNLYAMDDMNEQFDLTLIERAVRQYPKNPEPDKESDLPVRTQTPLSEETAFGEAGNLLEDVRSLSIPLPGGKIIWGCIDQGNSSFRFCDAGSAMGLTGIAVFAAAYAYVSGDERSRSFSDRIVSEAAEELNRMYEYLSSVDFSSDYMLSPGEYEGIGGIITVLELLRRYSPKKELEDFCGKIGFLLGKINFSEYYSSDRVTGIAGLVSAMCRSPLFRNEREIIRRASDRLIEMKTLDYNGKTLWKTLPGIQRPISGAGHGAVGIAEALFAAADVLGEEKYISAAKDALDFECEVYEKYFSKFGTWADLRTYPPNGYMHGYCSGAPGIGIMLERMKDSGGDKVKKLTEYARSAADSLPLNLPDYLCCGNSAVAEYYLTVGDRESAGKVLGAMYDRRNKDGGYRYYGLHTGKTASLFYGVSGVGYEMLRYAFPEKIISVL